MDRRVIYIVIGVVVLGLSISLLKLAAKDEVAKPVFKINPTSITVGKSIQFSDKTPQAEEWEWDFGDGNSSYEAAGLYTYAQAGTYVVKLTVNNRLSDSLKISVKDSIIKTTGPEPVIQAPKTAVVGQTVTLKDPTPGASSWQWKFGESGTVDRTEQTARYAYKNPGTYTIVLSNNVSKQEARFTITVKPPVPETVIVYKISDSDFEGKLQNIANGGFEKGYPELVKNYICQEQQITVMVNGKEKFDTLKSYCESLVSKKVKIKSVKLIRDATTQCITFIEVKQKEK